MGRKKERRKKKREKNHQKKKQKKKIEGEKEIEKDKKQKKRNNRKPINIVFTFSRFFKEFSICDMTFKSFLSFPFFVGIVEGD